MQSSRRYLILSTILLSALLATAQVPCGSACQGSITPTCESTSCAATEECTRRGTCSSSTLSFCSTGTTKICTPTTAPPIAQVPCGSECKGDFVQTCQSASCGPTELCTRTGTCSSSGPTCSTGRTKICTPTVNSPPVPCGMRCRPNSTGPNTCAAVTCPATQMCAKMATCKTVILNTCNGGTEAVCHSTTSPPTTTTTTTMPTTTTMTTTETTTTTRRPTTTKTVGSICPCNCVVKKKHVKQVTKKCKKLPGCRIKNCHRRAKILIKRGKMCC